MSESSRREILQGLVAGAMVGAVSASVARPATAEPQSGLVFRYPLASSSGRVMAGGWAKEASVREFPISKGLAGVFMGLKPGALRELHWHADAAEWGYVISGRCRTTVYDPDGTSEFDDFNPGDLWNFPRGHGHSIQAIGDEECRFMLIFDNGTFSEFSTFSVTDWLAHAPRELVARNLGVPASELTSLPGKEVYIATGPVPGPLPQQPVQGAQRESPLTHRYQLMAQQPQVFPGGKINLVTRQEFPLSTTLSGGIMVIDPGGFREMHWHPNADEWQYVLSGRMRMTVFESQGKATMVELSPGDVGYVPMGMGHYLENTGNEEVRLLLVFNSGDYQEISLAEWLSSNPAQLLATNLNLPLEVVRKFPKGSMFMP